MELSAAVEFDIEKQWTSLAPPWTYSVERRTDNLPALPKLLLWAYGFEGGTDNLPAVSKLLLAGNSFAMELGAVVGIAA